MIKSYTDLEQSKKLAKILPIESADMLWGYYYNGKDYCVPNIRPFRDMHDNIPKGYTPAWSLAALLGVLPNGIVMNKDSQSGMYHFSSTHVGMYVTADNPLDACVDIIIKLHELNLL